MCMCVYILQEIRDYVLKLLAGMCPKRRKFTIDQKFQSLRLENRMYVTRMTNTVLGFHIDTGM